MLKGDKVVLRPVRRSDLENYLKWVNDMEVTQYLTLYLSITEMAEEKYIEEMGTTGLGKDAIFIIEALEGEKKKPIGCVELGDLDNKNHNAVFGIVVGEKEYWSSGYGTEATRLIIKYGFEQLNLHRISSFVYAFNERSRRLHTKVGFKEEGLRREFIFKNGEYHDEVMFGLLKSEWLAKNTKN